jgi:hypothetical protein
MAAIRWRVARKALIGRKDWASRPSCPRERAEPHPPCPTIVMLPAAAERRDPALVTHSVADILRARMLAVACGYEDADALDHLRTDPGCRLARASARQRRRSVLATHRVARTG